MKSQQTPLVYIILLSVLFTSLLFLISFYFQNQQFTPMESVDPPMTRIVTYPTRAPIPR